jgi:hypothetical protein
MNEYYDEMIIPRYSTNLICEFGCISPLRFLYECKENEIPDFTVTIENENES